MADLEPVVAGASASLLRNGRLSIRKVVAHAVALLFRHAGLVVVTMIPPVVLMTAIRQLADSVIGHGISLVYVHWLIAVVSFLILWVGFASVLHGRFLGAEAAKPWRVVLWSRPQISFLLGVLKLFGVMILLGLATIVLAIVPVGNVIGVVIAAIVWARYAMVFPAAGVGRPISLGESWRLTGDARFRVPLLMGPIYMVGQLLIAAGLFWPVIMGPFAERTWLDMLIVNAAIFSWSAIVVALLSAIYRGLIEMQPPEARETYIPEDGKHFADAF